MQSTCIGDSSAFSAEWFSELNDSSVDSGAHHDQQIWWSFSTIALNFNLHAEQLATQAALQETDLAPTMPTFLRSLPCAQVWPQP